MKTFAFSSLFLLCLSIPALAQHRSVEERHREYLAKRQAAPPPASSAPAPSATASVPLTLPIPGAPPLPTGVSWAPLVILNIRAQRSTLAAPLDLSKYPTPDVVPPTDSPARVPPFHAAPVSQTNTLSMHIGSQAVAR